MNYSIYRFTLDIHKTKSQVSIPVLYRDTGIKFYISLTDGGKPYFIEDGCRAVFSAKKPDGNQLFNDCIIEDNTRIRYDFTAQTTNCEGMMNCEMRLYGKDGKLLTTPAFVVIVDPRVVYDSDILESYPESTTLDNIVAAENARVEGEQERVDAEAVRVIVENARAAAETARAEAENVRVDAEGVRADSEKTRVANEAERVAAFAHMLGSWVAYSMYEDGTDYTYTWSEGQRYIGICNGKTPPADKTGFVWSKFVDTGIYIGSGEMPSWCNLQIDPDGEVTEIVQEPGQSDMNVMSQKAVSNTFANALKGNVSGEAVRIDDASPVTHDMAVKVSRKNLFDVSKVKTYMPDQMSFSLINNGDGSITVNVGTQTSVRGGAPYTLGDYAPDLKVGETYTLSAETTGTNKYIYLSAVAEIWNFGTSKVITAEMLASRVNWYASGAGTTATISNIQIEQGKTATTYAPYIEPSAVKVRTQGKNLFPYPFYHKSKMQNGVTWTDNGDGTITATGTATDTTTFSVIGSGGNIVGIAGKTVSISGCPKGGSTSTYYFRIQFKKSGGGILLTVDDTGNGKPNLLVPDGTSAIDAFLAIRSGAGGSLVFKPQIEIGEAVTEHEPYIEPTEYAVNEDGTVDGVTLLDPTTTLMTDTAGAVLDVTYTRDANKVVNELTSRLAALESAVLK